MKILVALVAGLIFGIGLIVSGMTNPAKVQNFLDLFGSWDPSLAFVMGGAIVVASTGYRLVVRRDKPLFTSSFSMPTRTDIDFPLVAGTAIFGVGWGIGGFCPGPALTSLAGFAPGTLFFLISMLAGMGLARLVKDRIKPA